MPSIIRHAAFIALGGVLLAGPAHANLLNNGDFEIGVIDNSSTVPFWTTGNIDYNGFSSVQLQNAALVSPTTGLLVMFNTGDTNPGGFLSQGFSTVIGQSYTLSFDYGKLNAVPQDIGVTITGAVLDFSQLLSAVAINSLATYTYSFTASAAIETITFSDLASSTFGSDGLLDNVSIVADEVVEAPEPAALGLFLFGLGGAALLRRRGKGGHYHPHVALAPPP